VLILQKELRKKFKKPLGELYDSLDDIKYSLSQYDYIISVGDVTTKNLIESKFLPNLGIIDNKIQRGDSTNRINYDAIVLNAKNPAGTITDNLWETIDKAISSIKNSKNNYLIVVKGEEDLAVLPCILLAPKNTVIMYGQPNEGLVVLDAETVKKKAEKLINEFEEIN
jgi:hypothetical protein